MPRAPLPPETAVSSRTAPAVSSCPAIAARFCAETVGFSRPKKTVVPAPRAALPADADSAPKSRFCPKDADSEPPEVPFSPAGAVSAQEPPFWKADGSAAKARRAWETSASWRHGRNQPRRPSVAPQDSKTPDVPRGTPARTAEATAPCEASPRPEKAGPWKQSRSWLSDIPGGTSFSIPGRTGPSAEPPEKTGTAHHVSGRRKHPPCEAPVLLSVMAASSVVQPPAGKTPRRSSAGAPQDSKTPDVPRGTFALPSEKKAFSGSRQTPDGKTVFSGTATSFAGRQRMTGGVPRGTLDAPHGSKGAPDAHSRPFSRASSSETSGVFEGFRAFGEEGRARRIWLSARFILREKKGTGDVSPGWASSLDQSMPALKRRGGVPVFSRRHFREGKAFSSVSGSLTAGRASPPPGTPQWPTQILPPKAVPEVKTICPAKRRRPSASRTPTGFVAPKPPGAPSASFFAAFRAFSGVAPFPAGTAGCPEATGGVGEGNVPSRGVENWKAIPDSLDEVEGDATGDGGRTGQELPGALGGAGAPTASVSGEDAFPEEAPSASEPGVGAEAWGERGEASPEERGAGAEDGTRAEGWTGAKSRSTTVPSTSSRFGREAATAASLAE